MTTKKPHVPVIDRLIDAIRKTPGIRTTALAEALDVPTKNVMPSLMPAIDAGAVVACKVERPGLPPVNEYRLSASFADAGQGVRWRDFVVGKKAPGEYHSKPDVRATVRPPTGATSFAAAVKQSLTTAKPKNATPQPAEGPISPAAPDRAPPKDHASLGAGAVVEPPAQVQKPASVGSDVKNHFPDATKMVDVTTIHDSTRQLGPRYDDEDDSDAANYARGIEYSVGKYRAHTPVDGAYRFTIDNEGYVEIERAGRTVVTLTPTQTAALGDFMAGVEFMWRP